MAPAGGGVPAASLTACGHESVGGEARWGSCGAGGNEVRHGALESTG